MTYPGNIHWEIPFTLVLIVLRHLGEEGALGLKNEFIFEVSALFRAAVTVFKRIDAESNGSGPPACVFEEVWVDVSRRSTSSNLASRARFSPSKTFIRDFNPSFS